MQMYETQVRSLCREDPLEEGMATHSSILAWRIPGTPEPSGLQSRGVAKSQTRRKRHRMCMCTHARAHTHTHTHTHEPCEIGTIMINLIFTWKADLEEG